jgi:hypothetical protein
MKKFTDGIAMGMPMCYNIDNLSKKYGNRCNLITGGTNT